MSETVPCPTCQRPVLVHGDERPASFPFCSPRCRHRDLGAWIDGRYVVPGRELEDLTAEDGVPRGRDQELP
jgi:endogenous inhibitor of DNA gyrase (YacG/DUF329 family)